MSEKPLIINGKSYISSRRAAEIFGYTNDYVGQLARAGKIDSTIVGRSRYVDFSSISDYVRIANGAVKRFDRSVEAQFAPVISSKTVERIEAPIMGEEINLDFFSSRGRRLLHVEQIGKSAIASHVLLPTQTGSIKLMRVLSGACAVLATMLFFVGSFIGEDLSYQGFVYNEAIAVNSTTFRSILNTGTEIDKKYLGFLDRIEDRVLDTLFNTRKRFVRSIKSLFGEDEIYVAQLDSEQTEVGVEELIDNDSVISNPRSLTENEVRAIASHVIDETLAERIDYFSQARNYHEGIVAAPLSSDLLENERIKNQIRNSFSDRVDIDLAPDRSSGIIQPIFRDASDDQYFFVIVPVNEGANE